MATRCLLCHLLESLCISMTVESLKKERKRWVRGACQQMSHHSICCESTIGRHKERKIKIWQWQINLKTNWLSQAEFINAFTTPPLWLAVIKMQWSQSDVCRFRCWISLFKVTHNAGVYLDIATDHYWGLVFLLKKVAHFLTLIYTHIFSFM